MWIKLFFLNLFSSIKFIYSENTGRSFDQKCLDNMKNVTIKIVK